MKSNQNVQTTISKGVHTVILSNQENRNSINAALIEELERVLSQAERDVNCRLLVIKATGDTFCDGLDFGVVTHGSQFSKDTIRKHGEKFYRLMSSFVNSRIIIVAAVDGQVSAGGIGLVSAADFVVSTYNSQYALPEALWGLVPYCITPFLVKRIGYQKAKNLALSTYSLSAEHAFNQNLVDDLTENLEFSVRKLINRISQLDCITLQSIKSFYNTCRENSVCDETNILDNYCEIMSSPKVKKNIARFIEEKKFPWET